MVPGLLYRAARILVSRCVAIGGGLGDVAAAEALTCIGRGREAVPQMVPVVGETAWSFLHRMAAVCWRLVMRGRPGTGSFRPMSLGKASATRQKMLTDVVMRTFPVD
jgi:hypothetical protein